MAFKNGKTYRFINRCYAGFALNVFGTSAASTGRNVCLYANDPTDIMQDWVVKERNGGYRLHSAVNQSYVLDCSDGSMKKSYKNNAHLCITSQTTDIDSKVLFERKDNNIYKIYLPGKNLYLTATNSKVNASTGYPASSIENETALTGGTGGESNVYWAKENTNATQEWIVSPDVDGGTIPPDPEPPVDPEPGTAQYLALPINNCTITAMYKEDSSPAYKHEYKVDHYGLDMYGWPNPFYASGNGTVVGVGGEKLKGVGYWAAIRYDNVYSWNMENDNLRVLPSIIVRYYHLLEKPSLTEGQKVTLETRIGTYDKTGQWYNTMGKHLHVEVDTDIKNPLYTPTLRGSVGGLYAGNQGEGDTTIDPCTVFFKKESGVENQSLNYDKLYCGEHPPKTDASEEEKEKDAFYNKKKMEKFMQKVMPG